MKKESRRSREVVRFLKWTKKYNGWWKLICTPDDEHMNAHIMKQLIEKLAEERFYEIIFVLCMVHRNAVFMADFPASVLLDMLVESWKMDAEEIIAHMLRYLK